MVLPQHDVKGMGGLKFFSVCRRAGLVDDDCITPRSIRDLFSIHTDTVRNSLLQASCAAHAPLLLDVCSESIMKSPHLLTYTSYCIFRLVMC